MNTSRSAVTAIALALLVAASGCARKPSAEQQQAWNGELSALQAEQDSLRARAAELVAQDPRILGLPPGDIVVAVPTDFVRGVIDRVLRDVAEHVTLSLSGIKVHKEQTVKKVVTIGKFTVDVDVQRVTGKLEPGEAAVEFGGDSVSVSLPVAVKEGDGEAMIHFVWDGKNVADLTCGDMDVTQKVSGTVIPANYTVRGAFFLSKEGAHVVATPRFPVTKLRLRLEPSKESWAAIDSILAGKDGVCGKVLDKVDVPNILQQVTEEKGFNIRLPFEKLKPIALPTRIQDSVPVGDKTLAISAKTNTVRIDPDAIWYSADVQVQSGGAHE